MPPTTVQTLNKIRAAGVAVDPHEEDFFDCCWCGNHDDVTATASRNSTLPSTEAMAEVFWKILDAPTNPNDPLEFAVEALIPLQQVTKWALKSEFTHEDDMTVFLSDVEKIRGIGIVLLFLSNHINDAAAVMCSVRAIHALMVDADNDWDGKKATPLSRARCQLIRDFLRENGIEILTRAFGLHALTATPPDSAELFSQMELRTKTMEILIAALPHSVAASAANVLRFLCNDTPKMIGMLKEKDKFANKMLLLRTILCLINAAQVGGIINKLTMEDRVGVVNISVLVLKACPNDDQITLHVRDLWSWAANA